MAPEIYYDGYKWRLRAGKAMPTQDGNFRLHTFGAETSKIRSFLYTEILPETTDFRGQGGTENLISASFNRLPTCDGAFQGKQVWSPEWHEESAIEGDTPFK